MQIVCPNCRYQRDVPDGAIPAGVLSVTCPRCKKAFPLARTAGGRPPAPDIHAPPPGHAVPDRTGHGPRIPIISVPDAQPSSSKFGGVLMALFSQRVRMLLFLFALFCVIAFGIVSIILQTRNATVARTPAGSASPGTPAAAPAPQMQASSLSRAARPLAPVSSVRPQPPPTETTTALVIESEGYFGTVKLNDTESITIDTAKGDRFSHKVSQGFVKGRNRIEVSYLARASGGKRASLKIEVVRSGPAGVLQSLEGWDITDAGGKKVYTVNVPDP